MGYMVIMTIIISLALACHLFRNKNGLPTNWPLLGMLPAILKNFHRINEFVIELMEKSNMTFHFIGPWFTNMHLFITVDPTNFDHVLSKKFQNYPKGSKLIEVLEPFGDGIFNSNPPLWNYHKKLALSFFNNPKFHNYLVDIMCKKLQTSLIPILDHASDHAIEIDLEDIFLRLMYDTMSIIALDHDPISLSLDLPNFPVLKAVVDMSNVVVDRFAMPTCLWKLLRWLNVGEEKKFKQGLAVLDSFIYNCIKRKREEMKKRLYSKPLGKENEVSNDLLLLLMDEVENMKVPIGHNNDKFLRDTIANFFLAGGETTSTSLSWFFYLLSKNPHIFQKIKEELNACLTTSKDNSVDWSQRNFKDIESRLIYLHAALCESLRLYPTVAFNCKEPSERDILPSGHQVNPNMQIILNHYAMGRMKSIWGDDCYDFKPERWILGGAIKHEPSYKFSAFSTGPRTCIGKQMAFTQMKVVATTIIHKYNIEVLGNIHVPSDSLILHMKHGIKVKVLHSQS